MNGRSRRPTANEIVPRLLDAVESLCSEGSPDEATMRAIAREAGLSVGVAYRYFESRDALLGAAMERMGARLADAALEGDDPAAFLGSLWQAINENPAFARLATWLALTGRTPSDLMRDHPLARAVTQRASERGMEDPPGTAAVVLFLTLSSMVFGSSVKRAVGRSPDDRRLEQDLAEMFRPWWRSRQVSDPAIGTRTPTPED